MTVIQAVKAYKAADKLSSQIGLKRKTSIKVFLLREALYPAFLYDTSEEQKIIEAHPNFDPLQGTIRIENDDAKTATDEMIAIQKEFDELHNSEWEMSQFGNLPGRFTIGKEEPTDGLTPNEIGALMQFIDFEDEE